MLVKINFLVIIRSKAPIIFLIINLKINQNHSTMLSVRSEKKAVRVSLHQMFLKAPEPVVDALSRFIKGKSKKKSILIINDE